MLGREEAAISILAFIIIFLLILGILNLFEWLDLIKNFIWLPLGPQELVVTPFFEVTHGPPETRL